MPDQDLYRFLLQESKDHRDRISTLWLQKFSMLGAIIAFAAVRSEVSAKDPQLVGAALLSLPVIAVLLDAKLTEFAVHALAIDSFIIRNYPDPPERAEWERTKWGWSSVAADRGLIRARTIATVCSTVIPTCMIAVLSVLALTSFLHSPDDRYLRSLAIIFCVIYLGIGISWARILILRPPASIAETVPAAGKSLEKPPPPI